MALRADVECRVLTLWGVDKADLAVQHTSSLGKVQRTRLPLCINPAEH